MISKEVTALEIRTDFPAEYKNLDEYVNNYNSKTDKTKLMILETHQVNNNNDTTINNEVDVGNDGIPDDNDNYGVIYDRTDDAIPPPLQPGSNIPCIHSIIEEVNKDFKFWIDILNVKSARNYGDNDDNNNNDNTCNDTVPNYQINNNSETINLSPIELEVNKEYQFCSDCLRPLFYRCVALHCYRCSRQCYASTTAVALITFIFVKGESI